MNPKRAIKKVAVIGAGIAGLSCARALQSSGISVDIFEKSRGPSGRMSTRRTEDWSADHGAQYFTARDPRFIQELQDWIQAGTADTWSPKLKVYEANAWRDSDSQEARYVGTPNMSSPGKYLTENLSIQYERTITRLESRDGEWALRCSETGEIATLYDFVVLALPAPQVSALAGDLDPQLAYVTGLAQMKACWTMMAHFPKQLSEEFDAAFVNQEIISWVCQNNSKPMRQGKLVWTIHGNPSWSQENVELSKEEAQAQMLACLRSMGFDCQDSEISMHRWRYSSGGLNNPIQFLLLPNVNLGLCGDWLNGGRVEGAWLSGLELASEINNGYKN